MTLRCSCGSIQLSVNATPEPQPLAKGTADLEFVAKFGELWDLTFRRKKYQKFFKLRIGFARGDTLFGSLAKFEPLMMGWNLD